MPSTPTPRVLSRRLGTLFVVLALVASACGSDADGDAAAAASSSTTTEPASETEVNAATSSECPPLPTDVPADKPVVELPDVDGVSELEIADLIEGDGEVAEAGDVAVMQYVGVLLSDGCQFDSSWDRGTPFEFQLGAGQVIVGWDQGIPGMKVGGRRMLTIPSEQAYGATGSPGGIGPDEDLVFVVDLVSLAAGPEPVDSPDVEIPADPATELIVEDISEGDGGEAAEGDLIEVHYVGVAQSTGEVFDSSYERGETIQFPLVEGGLIEGWVQGIPGMKEGGTRRLVIPGSLAYGDAGRPPVIGPDETLVFLVELVSVTN